MRHAPLAALLAQGDAVVLVTAREYPHPARAGATYIKPGMLLRTYGVESPVEESHR